MRIHEIRDIQIGYGTGSCTIKLPKFTRILGIGFRANSQEVVVHAMVPLNTPDDHTFEFLAYESGDQVSDRYEPDELKHLGSLQQAGGTHLHVFQLDCDP